MTDLYAANLAKTLQAHLTKSFLVEYLTILHEVLVVQD